MVEYLVTRPIKPRLTSALQNRATKAFQTRKEALKKGPQGAIALVLAFGLAPVSARAMDLHPGDRIAPTVDTVTCPYASIASKLEDLDMSGRNSDAEHLMDLNHCDIITGYETNKAVNNTPYSRNTDYTYVKKFNADIGIVLMTIDFAEAQQLTINKVFFAPISHFAIRR